MSFKRTDDGAKIDNILKNHSQTKQVGQVTPLVEKVRERTKQYTFTMRPSVREKLTELAGYDIEFTSDSAASYLSELIEKRHSEVFGSK